MDHYSICLLLGVLVTLLAVTSIVNILRKRTALGIDAALIETLRSRVRSWWLLFGMLVGAFLCGHITTVILFALISFWALREYITLTPTRPADHLTLVLVFFLCTPFQFCLVAINPEWFLKVFNIAPYLVFSIFVPVYVFLLLPAGIAISGDSKQFLERVAKIQVGLLICVYSLSFAPALLTMNVSAPPSKEHQTVTEAIPPDLEKMAADAIQGGNGFSVTADSLRKETAVPLQPFRGEALRLLFFFVLIVQAGDVFQYLWSQPAVSRHVIAPAINSSRTWEGVLGGAATTSVLSIALWWVTPFPYWWQTAFLGFTVSIMGFAGSLTMSAIKRDRGVKDYGSLIEGHNGILDRIDSMCFAAPVFYHLVWFFLHT
ncbi:MAG: phosphatidate cytidylyltransferase [Planctomycetaceae bacterium]|jgi:phosphatidate cytidylyltransferase|nr:phosphatidate cytidylyltransferase [Planctomycetaceae bacterium]